jgi:hypothetical protein
MLFMTTLFSVASIAQVDVYSDLYSESDNGSVYLNTAYNIYTDNTDDLSSITVGDDVDFLSVYYKDGSDANQSYSLHDVAGKNLKEIFNGNNQENQHVNISSLRDDYLEWYKLRDGSPTLVKASVVARVTNAVDVKAIEVTTDLQNENNLGTQYKTTAYFVKGIATMDDLENIIIGNNIAHLNIYLKNNGGDEPYIRKDYEKAAISGKTLKAIFADSIAIGDLYWDYREWFKKDGRNTLVNLNVKAVEVVGTEKIEITHGLFAPGQHEYYSITGYKVFATATETDLENVAILAAEVDHISIYKKKGLLDTKRIDVIITSDTNLKAVLAAAVPSVTISDLKDNYREWFYKKNEDGTFSPTLLNINIKASKVIGTVPMVTVTDGLYSTGSVDYINKAFFVNTNATDEELGNHTLNGDAGTNIYYVDADGKNQNLNVQGTDGKTLKELLDENNITLSMLRKDYVEWFKDVEGKSVLVKLNIKQKRVNPDAVKVVETRNLKSKSGSNTFDNTAYYAKTSASVDDLANKKLDDDIELLNVYTVVNDIEVRHSLHGVGGKTLKEVIEGGSNEGTVIDFATLEHSYVEWFKDASGKPVLVKLNFKAVRSEALSSDENVIADDMVSVYPNPVVNSLNIKMNDSKSFEYAIYDSNARLVLEGNSKKGNTVINVSSLTNGVYFIKLTDGNKYYTGKFVK